MSFFRTIKEEDNMKRVLTIILGLALVLSFTCAYADDWPQRTVNIIVYSSAGGSTDLSNRAIAEGLKKPLGVDVVASNMPGAMGGTAVNYVWNGKHDGYTFAGVSEGYLGQCVLGIHTTTARDWEWFMVGGTPGIISVKAGSPYKDFQQLYDDVKIKHGQIRIATSIPGCIWHIQWLTAKKYGGFDPKFVPYPGSFPSQTACMTGEIEVVWTGLGEQSEFIKGRKLQPLAVFDTKPLKFAGLTIPPITKYIPELEKVMPINQFVGFALPSDTPKSILAKVTDAFKVAMKHKAVADFGKMKYSELYGYCGEKAKTVAINQQKVFAWLLYDEGIAKKSPAEFGIPRP
jgi:tripartite-type tricarboxylate transporter receptor subunit TctC